MGKAVDMEFYQTPAPFTRWLFKTLRIGGLVGEVCCGDQAIVNAADLMLGQPARTWATNDLDCKWSADFHGDAASPTLYDEIERSTGGVLDWNIGNPPFTPAVDIITNALAHVRVGVAMHLRASIHEVLKTGARRTWMAETKPTGILWLPRFAYQRSKSTGKWSTDSVCACWVVWLKDPTAAQFIRYAPESVLDELEAYTPAYRRRMDELMARLAA